MCFTVGSDEGVVFGSLITSACGSSKNEGARIDRLFLSWQLESPILIVKTEILQKMFGVTITYICKRNRGIGNGEF